MVSKRRSHLALSLERLFDVHFIKGFVCRKWNIMRRKYSGKVLSKK